MRDIWGWLGSSNQNELTAKAILAAMAGNNTNQPHATLNGERGALAVGSNGSLTDEDDVMVAICGRPRFLNSVKNGLSPAQSVLLLWRKHGQNLFAQISGPFAIAVIDRRANSLLLAVDRMGIHRLCFAPTADGLVFGSNCDAVVRHPAVEREIDPQGVFNYLYAHMVPAPGTIYRCVEKLLPAQYALFQNDKLTRGFYWEARWEDDGHADFELKSKEFHTLLDQCVREALDEKSAGAFLSGGTDSSTIAGMLTRVSGKPAETFSIGFEAEGFDEIEYARTAVRHFGTHPHEYYVTQDDVVRAIPLIAANYDEPFGNASAVPTYFCALKAKEACIEVMLAGDGGDEIFGGNTRYAKQKIFEVYGRVPSILRKGLIEPLLMHTPGVDAFMPTRKAKSYIQQAKIPLPDRLETYNYLNRDPLDAIFTPEFLRAINQEQPAGIQREVYFRTKAQSPINRMLHLDWKQTLADSDLIKVNRMCEIAGVEVRYPLLDERMVAFAAMLPPDYKVHGQKLRWFFKGALKDFLPHEILTKSKHGFGLPFGVWMKEHPALFELAHDSLHAFRSRGYVRQEYMDRLIQAHQTEHANYYGVMIWVIMMLEQWFQHHDNKAQ